MASSDLRPVIAKPGELAAFIENLLRDCKHAIRLVICSSQEEFLEQLLASTVREKEKKAREAKDAGFETSAVEQMLSRTHELLIPTLHQLSLSHTIEMVFCPSLPHLQAYLGVYATRIKSRNSQDISKSIMAVLNPLALHRNTPSFSAQGINRTLASAVEASLRANDSLIIMESLQPVRQINDDDNFDECGSDNGWLSDTPSALCDPWNEEISILNVTTKSFGAGDRGWVGRTVNIRSIAERWFNFE